MKFFWHFSALLLATAPLADGGDLAFSSIPIDKIGLVTALIVAIIVIWKLNGKLAADKDGVQKDLIQFHKERADSAQAAAANYEKVVNSNTTALNGMTSQLEKQGDLLKGVLHELEKKDS